ncbi:MAG: M23 family metallopeptidase [Anaerolineales bacterium]|nr:M23 family metallopeptidase [Anaerolineales bacterium]
MKLSVASIGEVSDTAVANKVGYRLPWPAPGSASINTNYRNHGTGQMDFGIGSGMVVAAKAGTVVYLNDKHTQRRCDSTFGPRYNNVVVIKHGGDEYTLYLHLATGSIPSRIKDAFKEKGSATVNRGDIIGRQGNIGYTWQHRNPSPPIYCRELVHFK